MTFAAPKSVSIESEVFANADVRAAHEVAVEKAMKFLEEKAATARISGEMVNTGNLTYAIFEHATSRAGDPQTHSHVIVANLTYDESGKAYSLSNEKLMEMRTTSDAVYKNELAISLVKAGYQVEWDKKGNFEIQGYSKDNLDTFSKRNAEIRDALAERGLDKDTASHAARQTAALDTRNDKNHPENAESHREKWQKEAMAAGINPAIRNTLERLSPAEQINCARDAIHASVNHLSEREAAFNERDILKDALRFNQGIASTGQIQQAMREMEKSGYLIQRVDGKYTTKDAVDAEKSMGDRLSRGVGNHDSIMNNKEFVAALARFEERKGFALSVEQQNAARMILTGDDRFQGVQGLAGTGKTTMLEFIKDAAESKGWEIKGFSNGGAQADKMKQESGIQSTTTARHLIDADKLAQDAILSQKALDTFEQNRGVFGKQADWNKLEKQIVKGEAKLEFDSHNRAYVTDKDGNTWTRSLDGLKEQAAPAGIRKSLHICDEASMSGQSEFNRVINATEQQGARTVFLGDLNQHQSVNAGKSFELAQHHMPMAILGKDSIRRQTTEHAKDAVSKILDGKHSEAVSSLRTKETIINQYAVIEKYAGRDLSRSEKAMMKEELKEASKQDNQAVIREIAKDYSSLTGEDRSKTLIITSSNADRQMINSEIREQLKAKGELQNGKLMDTLKATGFTKEELKRADTFEKGHVVEFNRDYPSKEIAKGMRGTVAGSDNRTNTVTVTMADGRKLTFDPAKLEGKEVFTEIKNKEFALGDKIAVTKNGKDSNEQAVKNGQTGTIEKIEGSRMSVNMEGGKMREFDMAEYKHLDHAYAMTSYKSQGQTFNNVLVHHNTDKPGMHSERETYVNVTRAREDITYYTQNSDKAALQSGQKLDKESALGKSAGNDKSIGDLVAKLCKDGFEPGKGSNSEERSGSKIHDAGHKSSDSKSSKEFEMER